MPQGVHTNWQEELRQIRFHLRAAAYTMEGLDLHKLFKNLDRDMGGRLSYEAFSRGIRRGKVPQPQPQP